MSLFALVDRDSSPPHWLWLGPVDESGIPITRTAMSTRIRPTTALVELLALTVGRRLKVPSCGNALCVSPQCNYAPVTTRVLRRLRELSAEERAQLRRRIDNGDKQRALAKRFRLAEEDAAKAIREVVNG